jgi:AcrR family transcriptional regulator
VRRRLLNAALDVCAELGFDNASVGQVASAAGLTKGAVYSNFANKDDLFFAMMTAQVLHRVETVRTAMAPKSGRCAAKRDLAGYRAPSHGRLHRTATMATRAPRFLAPRRPRRRGRRRSII